MPFSTPSAFKRAAHNEGPSSAPPLIRNTGTTGGSVAAGGSSVEDNYRMAQEAATQAAQAGQQVAAQNRAQFGADAESAVAAALRAAGMIDDYSIGRITELMLDVFGGQDTTEYIWGQAQQGAEAATRIANTYVNSVLPGLAATSTDIFNQAAETVSQYMSGQLPDDVQQAIITNVAESFPGLGADRFQNLAAKHLGLTSLELSQMGLNAAPGVAGMANQIGSLYEGGVNIAKTPVALAETLGGLRNTLVAPYKTTDVASLAGGFMNVLAGSSLDPNAVMSTTADLLSSGLGLGEQRYEYDTGAAEARRITGLNYQIAQQNVAASNQFNDELRSMTDALKASKAG